METGQVRFVYCHFDGYPKGVGKTLVEHYRDRETVEELLALGGLSILGDGIGERHSFDWQTALNQEFNERQKREGWPMEEFWKRFYADPEYKRLSTMTLAYHRDRGDPLDIREAEDVAAYYATANESWTEYAYLYRQGVWFYSEVGGGAGPFLVNVRDPGGELPANWKNLAGALTFDNADNTSSYAFTTDDAPVIVVRPKGRGRRRA